jgi:hypothetical protein
MAKVSIPKDQEAEEEITSDIAEADIEAVKDDSTTSDENDDDLTNASQVEFESLRDIDPTEPVWAEGPLAGDMVKWLDAYKEKVFVTSIDFDEHVTWRPLKRSEYAKISGQIEEAVSQISESEATMLNEELICQTCVLWPDYKNIDFDDLLAGIPTLVSQQILEQSGFTALSVREMY